MNPEACGPGQPRPARIRLVIDLATMRVEASRGLSARLEADGDTVHFVQTLESAEWTVLGHGRLFRQRGSADALRLFEELADSDAREWGLRVDGDFVAIVADRRTNMVRLISDRNGSYRHYYAVEKGKLIVAETLSDMAELMESPALSSFGVFSLLISYYALDPFSLLDGVRATMPGTVVTISAAGVATVGYCVPVQQDVRYYSTEEECAQALDRSLHAVFDKRSRTNRTPVVMLSGGIDSVGMLRYLSEHHRGPIRTVTFSVRGQSFTEHEPARLAAAHFGTQHAELEIDPADGPLLFLQAIREGLHPSVSTLLALATRRHLEGQNGQFDVFTGEDTRLHTPDFDMPRRIGIWLQYERKRGMWHAMAPVVAMAARAWPFYPRGYLQSWAHQLQRWPSRQDFFLRCLSKVEAPPGTRLETLRNYDQFLEQSRSPVNPGSIQAVFKKHIELAYRLQYTDNMVESKLAINGPRTALHVPFYDHETVSVSNRIPYHLGARGLFTFKSWSRFLVVNKRILRRVLSSHVPASILYRRKAVASALDVLMVGGLDRQLHQTLTRFGPDLFSQLDSEVQAAARAYIKQYDAEREEGRWTQRVVYACLSLAYASILAVRCAGRTDEVDVWLAKNSEV